MIYQVARFRQSRATRGSRGHLRGFMRRTFLVSLAALLIAPPLSAADVSPTGFLVRNEEMWQSLNIITQAYRKIQDMKGAEATIYHADSPEYYLPDKKDVLLH